MLASYQSFCFVLWSEHFTRATYEDTLLTQKGKNATPDKERGKAKGRNGRSPRIWSPAGSKSASGSGPPGPNLLANLVPPADLVPSIFAIYKIIKC